MTEKKPKPCPGWLPQGLPGCGKPAGTPWTPIWCPECDEKRRAHITRQLEAMLQSMKRREMEVAGE